MSDTVNNVRPRGSFLSTRAMNTLRYSVMNLFILFGTACIALGGPWTYMGLVFSFILVGYVDELFGDISDRENMPPIWYCQLMLFATDRLGLARLVPPPARHRSAGGARLDASLALHHGPVRQPGHVLRRRRRERRP